jgi:hypothetical protein
MYNNNTDELTQRFNPEEFADWQPRRTGTPNNSEELKRRNKPEELTQRIAQLI